MFCRYHKDSNNIHTVQTVKCKSLINDLTRAIFERRRDGNCERSTSALCARLLIPVITVVIEQLESEKQVA